jgi:hypothetical protein
MNAIYEHVLFRMTRYVDTIYHRQAAAPGMEDEMRPTGAHIATTACILLGAGHAALADTPAQHPDVNRGAIGVSKVSREELSYKLNTRAMELRNMGRTTDEIQLTLNEEFLQGLTPGLKATTVRGGVYQD